MGKSYTKIHFSDEEKEILKHRAGLQGMKLNDYVRVRALTENPIEVYSDFSKLEEHTKAIEGVREEIARLFFSSIEDKILLTDTISNLHKSIYNIEMNEAKFLRTARNIQAVLNGQPMDSEEDGEAS